MRVFMSADSVGGVWNYALELARGLVTAGDEVLLAAMGGRLDAGQQRAAAMAGLTVTSSELRLEWMEQPWQDLERAADWLLALATDFEPDVVHLNHYAHGALAWSAPVLMVAHSCVYSWYGAVHGRVPEPHWQRYRDCVRQGLQAADLVVAPTGAMLAEAERFYGPFAQTQVIYNGRCEQAFPARAKRPYIFSAGRVWDEAKNMTQLAEAAASLPWPIWIAGDQRHPDGEGVRQLAGVEMLGRLDQPAMAKTLGEAAVYALPARYEPFGLSVLEAALAGCALVLGDIPSLRELWQDAAVFVAPDDQDGLSSVLLQLCEDAELRHEFAARAQQRAQQYPARKMVETYRCAYGEIKENTGKAPGFTLPETAHSN